MAAGEEGGESRMKRTGGGVRAGAGMKRSAIKLSERLTPSYERAYLFGMAACAAALSHINAGLRDENQPVYIEVTRERPKTGTEWRSIDAVLQIV